MNLDEAIQSFKDEMEKQTALGHSEHIDNLEQMSEWLKELKAYRKWSGDAISRHHLLEEIAMLKKSPWFNENTYGSKVIRKEAVEIVEDVCIKREPSVTPQQRSGRWIKTYDNSDAEPFIFWECSECHWYQRNQTTYCPKCGSRMMEVEE